MSGMMPGAKEVATLKRGKRTPNGVKESPKKVTAPVAFSSKPGKAAMLAYITPEEAEHLRSLGQGHSEHGSGEEVAPGKRQHVGPRGLLSFNGQGGAGPGDGDAGDDTGGMGGDSEGEANDVSADNDGGETGEATDDVSSPGGSPLGGGGYGGPGDPGNTVGDAMGSAMGAKGFAGTGRGFGALGAVTGAITAAGEIAGEIARDRGMSVSTPTAAAEDDPATSRNEANDPSAFGGGDQGNDVGPGGVPGGPISTAATAPVTQPGTSATKQMAAQLRGMGRDGDTDLVHVREDEKELLRASGGRGTINPATGLEEFATADNFDEELYLQNRPDVAEAIESGSWTGSALDHYKTHGQNEGTVANAAEADARSEGFDKPFKDSAYVNWAAGKEAGKQAATAINNTESPTLPSPTPSTVPVKDDSTASHLDRILDSDSPLMRRAAAQGKMYAGRRGLLNSSMAAEAAQNAVIDVALPVASQDAAQGHQSNMQQQEIGNQQWLANLDASVRSEISVMQENTKREIANLQVAAEDRDNIAAMVTAAQQLYANEWATVVNNPDIPAEERDDYFVHIENMLQNQIGVIEGMYGVRLDWSSISTIDQTASVFV